MPTICRFKIQASRSCGARIQGGRRVRLCHFAGFKVRGRLLDGVDVEIQNALDLLLPACAAFFEPFQYIRRKSKVLRPALPRL